MEVISLLFKKCPYKKFEVETQIGFCEVDIEDLEKGNIFRLVSNGDLEEKQVIYRHRHVNYKFKTYIVTKQCYKGLDGIKRIGGVENG